jgi:hypothetical protein
MEPIQIIVVLISIFAMSRVLLQVRKNTMTVVSALFWTIIWLMVILAVVFPSTLGHLANLTGVGRGVDVIIYLSIIVLFYMIYRSYVRMENMEREITKLVREIAIIEREKANDKKGD